MGDFIWQDRLLIGNQKVDQQHRQLFDLANQLAGSKTHHDLSENIMRLYRHVREHFQAEESVMKDHAYPNYGQHVATHNLMLDKLIEVSDKINKNEWRRQDMLPFMHEWIAHILEEDSAIQDFVQDDSR